MGNFQFKSVGKTKEISIAETLIPTLTPFGIKTPLQLGDKEIFNVTYTPAEQVNDNLKNLLLTNWGARVGLYDFGANLNPLTSEFSSQEDFDTQAISRIKTAVGKWMPYVDLEDFISEVDRNENKNTAVINITITYNVPALNLKGKKIQIKLYAM